MPFYVMEWKMRAGCPKKAFEAEFLEWNTTPVLPDEEAGATAAKVFPEFAK
ncbi:hypothetical protein EMIHUDRAFT_194433 [Emiliania huxleyi CCMP1516]|uniref:Uncharacterized protein n=2 Tax=Emiliania huxleyi TaxID=2903 RepID=A0A0D3L1I2_EMIH1|nr:hypothetical protein EMIHUDRAFT_194433 [Emiliania huxleyi CCMP1516]EOD41867.1 hypothetical protein EMIHUDRAFT_194433 [Emiliania huxleyi CCMP1516]|eukprot:XP_005794296.1 hypothetical protein EMIHUDRAFT_194433 [Emiliania huxleyi CCMP1516]